MRWSNLKLSTALSSGGESMICSRCSRTRPVPPLPFFMRDLLKSDKMDNGHEYTAYSFVSARFPTFGRLEGVPGRRDDGGRVRRIASRQASAGRSNGSTGVAAEITGEGPHDGLLQHVEAVLSPEQFAREYVKRGAEHPGSEGARGVGAVCLAHRLGPGRVEERGPVKPATPGERFEDGRVRHVLVLCPDRVHHRIDEVGDRQAPPLARDHHAGGQVHVGRKELGLDVERNTELGTPAFEFSDAVRLSLPRAVREHDAPAAGVHVLHPHRNVVDLDPVSRRQLHEPNASQIGPVRQQPYIIVDSRRLLFHHLLAFLTPNHYRGSKHSCAYSHVVLTMINTHRYASIR